MLQSFKAIIVGQPRILILGSMPSARSFAEQQYYAHPYNAFWPILAQVFCKKNEALYSQCTLGQHHKIPFAHKQALLEREQIALWDVLATCERSNSADSSIRAANPNHICELLLQYPSIKSILLNGQKSSTLFRQKILPKAQIQDSRELHTLPSTSPAYAAMPFAQKLELWSHALL